MMKKMVLTALVLALSAPAMANDAAKLNFVKQLYLTKDIDDINDFIIIEKYGSAELKRLDKAQPNDEPCHLGRHSTAMAQDDDGKRKRNFVFSVKNGRVKASYLRYGKRQVSEYVLSCQGNRCTVHDIYLNGDSLKAALKSCANL